MSQLQSTSRPKKTKTVVIAVKSESGFYRQVKSAAQKITPKLLLTRIENSVSGGIPDFLICDGEGKFHFVELKFVKSGNVVNLLPSQVSWLTRHKAGSVWVLVKKHGDPAECFLYRGGDAVALRMDGLSEVEPVHHCLEPFDWPKIFNLITSE